jgi:hypothetical protein
MSAKIARECCRGLAGWIAAAILGGLAAVHVSPVRAQASCVEQLAIVDEQLADDPDLDTQLLIMLQTWRDQGARQCELGNDSAANARFTAVRMLLEQRAGAAARAATAAEERNRVPRDALAGEYLEGTWCATQDRNQERSLYVFEADGSHRIGPVENNFELVIDGDMDSFWKGYDGFISMEADQFVVLWHHYVITFERGPC